MEIEIRLPGPDEPFGPRRARPEDLGPDDLGNRGVLRARLEDAAKQVTADFAELESARRKAEEEIGLERAGVELSLERARLAALPEEDASGDGDDPSEDPLKAFTTFAHERIAGLPEGAREDAALHAGRERLRLGGARRDARHNARVARLQHGVDESLDALTAQAAREPESLVELAERGLGLLEATGEGLRFDAEQQQAMRGRFGTTLATAALRAMEPKRALAALQGSGLQSLVADEDTRAALTAELTAAEASQKRALKAETGALMRLHLEKLDRGEPGVPEIARDVEIDFGAQEARAFAEQVAAARQQHLLRQTLRFATQIDITALLNDFRRRDDLRPDQDGPFGSVILPMIGSEPLRPVILPMIGNEPFQIITLEKVADEILEARRRDPAAAVAEQPNLQELLTAAEEDPAQRGLAADVGLDLQKELGIPEAERRVLTRQGLADLLGQIEAAPPAQRVPLLQDTKESYGAHFDQVVSELESARLDPTTLALARRLDDPLAVRRLGALQGKTRAELSEGLDPAEVTAVSTAVRAAVPGPLAPAAERVALARYQQSGDQDDAVAVARATVGVEGDDRLAGGDGEDDVAEARSGDGITFGPEDVENEPEPRDVSEPTEGFEAQAPDGTAFAVTRGEDGSLVFTDPASGEQRSLPADLVGEVEAATAGDPAQRDLILRIAVETDLIESGGFAGEGTSEAERRQTFERLDAAILERLGPEDGANARAIANLRRALQRSLRATNQRDKLFHIQRDALPEAHRAAVLESAKRFGIEAADVLTDLLPVVGEIKAGLRAQEALEAYEAALEAGDTEAANQHLLAFGEALTEAVPMAGKVGRAGRAIPGLDKLKAKIGQLAADLLGAGRQPGGSRLGMTGPGVPNRQNVSKSDDLEDASGKPTTNPGGNPNTLERSSDGKRKSKPRVIDRHPPGHYTNWKTAEEYADVVDKTPTPGNKPANIYERHVAGPDTYHLVKRDPKTGEIVRDAEGEAELTFDADGLRGSTILESKHVEKPDVSPYIDGSKMPDPVRKQIHTRLDGELDRIRKFIEDSGNPLTDVEVIANTEDAAKFFRRKLEERGLKGRVVVRKANVP